MRLVDKEPPKLSASIAQVLLLLKLTAGRLYEGHKMIRETFSAKGFLTKYKDEMSSPTLKSFDRMNKYFGGKSAIQRIRKKFAFHLDSESIAAAYANAPPDFTSVEDRSDPGVTNVRNVSSPHWRRWLGVESRCVVPFTSFAENEVMPNGSRPPVWFALDDSRPLAFFAGNWTRWTSVRK
jgi:hypothetical protein